MGAAHSWIRRVGRIGLSLALAAGLLGGPWAATAAAPAALAMPLAGTFTVSTILDENTADPNLSLREALDVARGALTTGLTDGEKNLLGGCSFSGSGPASWFITGGCGLGVADTIIFSPAISIGSVIVLASPLPNVSDTAPTTINGDTNSVLPVINAVNLAAGENGLNIISSNNVIIGLMVKNAPQDGFHVTSNGNTFGTYSGATNNGRHGLYLAGDNNLVEGALFGVLSVADGGCGANGNDQNGILLDDDSDDNTIKSSVIGCNAGYGIQITGTLSADNTVGPGNSIGTNPLATVALANATGVYIGGDAQSNSVVTNTIGRNTGVGVQLSGADTRFNAVRANYIVYQGTSGIRLDSGARDNQIGSPLGGPASGGNTISLNVGDGIVLTGPDTRDNSIFNNRIGTDPSGGQDLGNGGNGVMISGGAHGNAIGQQSTERNVISGNALSGVRLAGGAHNNAVQGNRIGVNLTGTVALPNTVGVLIDGGAYLNEVGSEFGTAYLNLIAGNLGDGVQISGGGTVSNTVAANDIGINSYGSCGVSGLLPPGPHSFCTGGGGGEGPPLPNGGNGVALLGGTAGNVINTSNWIGHNGGSGIYSNNAGQTKIFNNLVFYNGAYGILLEASAVTVISQTTIFLNALDGLAERSGSIFNVWSQVQTYDNGGLGIDKAAESNATNTLTGPTPIITSTEDIGGGNLLIRGRGDPLTDVTSTVEVYIVDVDGSGSGEGRYYAGTALLASDGTWSLTVPLKLGLSGCLTAFQRDVAPLTPQLAQSSEFGLNWGCVTFLPLVHKP